MNKETMDKCIDWLHRIANEDPTQLKEICTSLVIDAIEDEQIDWHPGDMGTEPYLYYKESGEDVRIPF